MNIFYLIVILLALGGFFLTLHIFRKRRQRHTFVCHLGYDCDAVIYSEYSKFLGMPNDLGGVIYYAFIALIYTALIIFPVLKATPLMFLVVAATTAAFMFSLYLLFIQAFVLRQWCSWCLGSASATTLIFIFSIIGLDYGLISLLADYRGIIIIIHGVFAALGLGAVTLTDFFFFRFLKDMRISEGEADTLNALSQVIWFALAILIVSGLALYLPAMDVYNQSVKFLVKAVIVLVIVMNGAFLNLLISPRLVKISFQREHDHQEGELRNARRLAFALGSISLVSWYSAFILGMLDMVNMSFTALLSLYLIVLAVAVLVSQVVERSIGRRFDEKNKTI